MKEISTPKSIRPMCLLSVNEWTHMRIANIYYVHILQIVIYATIYYMQCMLKYSLHFIGYSFHQLDI